MDSNFINNAKNFTKNPLGIIGLFISLIYAFACTVLSVTQNNLNGANERLPLIWFIIIFPILILGCFTFLVVFHHKKLYAPSDYRNEDNFVRSFMGIEGEKVKLIKKSLEIPIDNLWRLNHWGSNYCKIVESKFIFESVNNNLPEDGSHIDLVNYLDINKEYEITCLAKSLPETTGQIEIWCHDEFYGGAPSIGNHSGFKTPTANGEVITLRFYSSKKDIRIHLQYRPGNGKIEVSYVKMVEL